jgi:hypothetical protein
MRKPEHVPETRATEAKVQTGPNREQRRHPERAGQAEAQPRRRDGETQPDVDAAPQDVADVRAKSSGHDKKTADRWNQ